MPIQASGPQGEAVGTTRCEQCAEIKQKRYAAVRQGDQRRAEAMATAMGRHQRAAH